METHVITKKNVQETMNDLKRDEIMILKKQENWKQKEDVGRYPP